ncbi:MAG TPA: hypothetical protein VGH03_00445 [Caulobacteraceae bacterium]|jgi:hypothetical protein
MTSSRTLLAGLGLAVAFAASAAMAQQSEAPSTLIPGSPPTPWNSNPGPPSAPAATTQSSLPTQPESTVAAQPVIDAQQVRSITRQFQTELNRLGGAAQITRCGPVLHLQPPQSSGYNEGYGGVCEMQVADRHMQAVMCDDRRGGKFSFTLAAIRDLDAVGRFISDNCFPEG